MKSIQSSHGAARRITAIGVLAAAALASATAVAADGATVTRGDLSAFATSSDPNIDGRAQMVRTGDGKTIVTVHVTGLLPETTYGSHVHQQACSNNSAGGHYKHDPAGAPYPPNELWPAFTTNEAGIGNGRAVAEWTAGPNAVSVVVHAPGGAKIACADLE